MTETRHPLSASLSFSGSSVVVSRPLKRRLTTTDLTFFTPAATSFKPRPYTPNGSLVQPKSLQPSRSNYRSVESLAIPAPIMDPSPNDITSIFIHPPFTSFPNSHLHPEGLSYALMALNPEWFLDPHDFISASSTNPNAIPYPPHLEPPRGWCPAKKKDLRDRGAEGWPEGEEPRLRCTFCRRTYAGVNAKSMWRRHVFEKHKIAMSNRRDGSDRPRGRGSNKENRQTTSKAADEFHGSLINLDVAPQRDHDHHVVPLKARFRSLLPADEKGGQRTQTRCLTYFDDYVVPSTPDKSFNANLSQHGLPTESMLPSMSPPLTPRLHNDTNTSDTSQNSLEALIWATSPSLPRPMIPQSPYDPLLTPSFRHSPPRLPSDQPWRFPSPSHPLHSSAQDICLTMLAPCATTPLAKCDSILSSSPPQGISLRTPSAIAFGGNKALDSEPSDSVFKPSSRTLFSNGHMATPDRVVHERPRRLADESPLSRSSRTATDRKNRPRALSRPIDDRFPDSDITSPDLSARGLLQDPFDDIYSSWVDLNNCGKDSLKTSTSPLSSPEVDSPVLRSSALPSTFAGISSLLGIDLTTPFVFDEDNDNVCEDESDYMLMYPPLTEEEGDEVEVAEVLAPVSYFSMTEGSECIPLETETTYPPKKRRRTIGGLD